MPDFYVDCNVTPSVSVNKQSKEKELNNMPSCTSDAITSVTTVSPNVMLTAINKKFLTKIEKSEPADKDDDSSLYGENNKKAETHSGHDYNVVVSEKSLTQSKLSTNDKTSTISVGTQIKNPCRVAPFQEQYLKLTHHTKWVPVREENGLRIGIVILKEVVRTCAE